MAKPIHTEFELLPESDELRRGFSKIYHGLYKLHKQSYPLAYMPFTLVRHSIGLTVVLLLIEMSMSTALAQIDSPLYKHPKIPLTITNPDGSIVEMTTVVVSTPQDQSQGLMHIRHLPIDQSMLFLNQPPRQMSIWMKNTHVSLDLWFVLPNKTIGFIARDRKPLSVESTGFNQPVLAVIEVNAGLSDLLGIQKGSKIKF